MHMRVGIFPGTFNPIHTGHISFAEKALEECKLDKVIFLPEKFPQNKQNVPAIESRVAYAQKQLQGHANLEIHMLKHYPVSVESEKEELKDIFDNSTVVLLLGTDTMQNLAHWQDVKLLLSNHEVCVGLRDDETEESVTMAMATLESQLGVRITAHVVATPYGHVSSTKIRGEVGYKSL